MRSHGVLNAAVAVLLLLATTIATAQNLASILANDHGADFPSSLPATAGSITPTAQVSPKLRRPPPITRT